MERPSTTAETKAREASTQWEELTSMLQELEQRQESPRTAPPLPQAGAAQNYDYDQGSGNSLVGSTHLLSSWRRLFPPPLHSRARRLRQAELTRTGGQQEASGAPLCGAPALCCLDLCRGGAGRRRSSSDDRRRRRDRKPSQGTPLLAVLRRRKRGRRAQSARTWSAQRRECRLTESDR
jgi:hypothetical protein